TSGNRRQGQELVRHASWGPVTSRSARAHRKRKAPARRTKAPCPRAARHRGTTPRAAQAGSAADRCRPISAYACARACFAAQRPKDSPGLLQPRGAPVVARRDLRRRLAVDDREFLVFPEHDVVRVAEEALPVHEHLQRLGGSSAVAADAGLRQPYTPDAEE